MILILGSSHDDILFYENLLSKKSSEVIYNRYPVTYGRMFNQDVALVSEVYTDYISALVTSYFIEKYFVILVINVGTCIGYSDNINFGDIAISNKVMLSDVDQISIRPVSLGQIPNGFPQFFEISKDTRNIFSDSFLKRNLQNQFLATYFSSNTFYTRETQLEPLKISNSLTSISDDVVFDCTLGGIALTCELHNVSYVGVKIVENTLGKPLDYEQYGKILSVYSEIGKTIASTIGDIASTDVLEEQA